MNAPAPVKPTRPFYWSVRRELWENRSIYIVPLVAAGVVLAGFLISLTHRLGTARAVMSLDPALQAASLVKRMAVAGAPVLLTAGLVAVFYCLDALHAERRDRSILFWKSLPVSDFTTVLSKASIALVVLPLVTFGVIIVLDIAMLLVSLAILVPGGLDAAALWEQLPVTRASGLLLYGLAALALWHAPIYAWLLLVSGWARRMTFLWAVLPPLALCVIERIAFGTWHLLGVLQGRLAGFNRAFAIRTNDTGAILGMPEPDPVRFLTTPGLWIGLAIAVALFAATVRMRRYREPI